MPDPEPVVMVSGAAAKGDQSSRSCEEELQAQIRALIGRVNLAETQMCERERLLAQANAQLARMSSRRDVFREMSGALVSEAAILRVERDRLRAELEARDDQVVQFNREMQAAISQVQRLSRAKEALALALRERERIDAERLEHAREEISRLRGAQEAKRIEDSRLVVALMERSWADEIPEDRSAA